MQQSNQSINIYKYETNPVPPTFGLPPTLVTTISNIELGAHLHCLCFVSPTEIIGAQAERSGESDEIIQILITESGVSEVHSTTFESKVLGIYHHQATDRIFIQAENGELYTFDNPEFRQINKFSHSFPRPCSRFAVCMINGHDEIAVGLTDRGVLYLQSHLAATNVTSFSLHSDFLLFTTTTHHLRLVPLSCNSVEKMIEIASTIPTDKHNTTIRDVERGSVIVCSVPHDVRVVLQMPRGNLEAIVPRALLLLKLKHALLNLEYGLAISMARTHRIDLNLIFDHDPDTFLAHCEEFVSRVNSAEYIDLFLSQLRNEDVTQTIFTSYEKPNQAPQCDLKNKTNIVCEAVREALHRVDETKFITSILTSYARANPPKLEDALTKIVSLRDDKTSKISVEHALKHLIFLADVNNLFDVALGMYDFDMVMLVAQRSQKDPKEYLPFLNNLSKLEKYYQRYTIDMHLERYEKALINISQAGDEHFNKCLELIEKHGLYKQALAIFLGKPQYNSILSLYAHYLDLTEKKHEQAGLAFVHCGESEEALQCFVKSGNYSYVFALAHKLNYPNNRIQQVAREVAEVLKKKAQYLECANVLKDYAQDSEEAVLVLLQTDHWEHAIHMAHLSNRTDLIATHIAPGVLEAFEERLNEVQDKHRRFDKYIGRLKEIRKNHKEMLALRGEDELDDTMSNAMDAFSETSSMFSDNTFYTNKSMGGKSTSSRASKASTSSKRDNRNRNKLRKGSAFEEENLVQEIRKMVPRPQYQEDISRLLKSLLYFGHLDKAITLQQKFQDCLHFILECADELNSTLVTMKASTVNPGITASVQELLGNFNWKLEIL